MDLNKCRLIGDYEISDICLLTYPCQHYVKNTITGESSRMMGDKIYTMLKEKGLSDKHFDDYAEYVRKRDNPTPEELAERRERERKFQEQRDKQKKEREEQERLTNQYKASSRLEKLKAKHNVC